jgi:uncharacterized membrane protein
MEKKIKNGKAVIIGILVAIAAFAALLYLSFKLCAVIPVIQNKYFLGNAFGISSKMLDVAGLLYIFLFLMISVDIYDAVSEKQKKKNSTAHIPAIKPARSSSIKHIRNIAIVVLIVIAYTGFNIFNYIKIDNEGISNKIYGLKKEFIAWDSVKKIEIDSIVTTGFKNGGNFQAQFILITDDKKLELWQDNSPGRLNFDEIKKTLDYIIDNTNIEIHFDGDFSEQKLKALDRRNNKSKDDIQKTFAYIREMTSRLPQNRFFLFKAEDSAG